MKFFYFIIFTFLFLSLAFTSHEAQTTWYQCAENPILEKGNSEKGNSEEWDSERIGIGMYVLFNGNEYQMWYHGQKNNVDALGYATSVDGITWQKYENNPVLELGETGAWDAFDLQMGCVILDGDIYKMYYDSHGSDG